MNSGNSTIRYSSEPGPLATLRFEGFFEGWPRRPSRRQQLALLERSSERILALEGDRVVGFVTALSDGVLAAYIPLLEVLPSHRGRGIGSQLLRRMLARLGHLYMVDLVCDPPLERFYRRHGLSPLHAMVRRQPQALEPEP